jgi:hypothetical protein
MKKKVLVTAVLVSVMFTAKSFLSTNQALLVSDNIEAISEETYEGGDLPEVEITCGKKYGPCWDGYERPFLGWKCPTFTGCVYDWCIPNMG